MAEEYYPDQPAALVALTERAAKISTRWSSATQALGRDAATKLTEFTAPLRKPWFGLVLTDEEALARDPRGARKAEAEAAAAAAAAAAEKGAPTVAGRAAHAQPAARAAGLWALPQLPTDADTAAEAWRDGVKESQALRLEQRQAQLAAEALAAQQQLRAAVAEAERDAALEIAQCKAVLDRALARSNAALAQRLARVEATLVADLARAAALAEGAAHQELAAAGHAEASRQQVLAHALTRLQATPEPTAEGRLAPAPAPPVPLQTRDAAAEAEAARLKAAAKAAAGAAVAAAEAEARARARARADAAAAAAALAASNNVAAAAAAKARADAIEAEARRKALDDTLARAPPPPQPATAVPASPVSPAAGGGDARAMLAHAKALLADAAASGDVAGSVVPPPAQLSVRTRSDAGVAPTQVPVAMQAAPPAGETAVSAPPRAGAKSHSKSRKR